MRDNYATERGWVRYLLGQTESILGRTQKYEQVDLSKVERLVFVCLGNICRSPFAEFVAKQQGVTTAGFGLSTTTGVEAFSLGVETAKKFNIDMQTHRTTDFKDFELRDSDLLLVMEIRHARKLENMLGESKAQIALLGHWATPRRLHIHDPHTHDSVYFENCYQVLKKATESLVNDYKCSQPAPNENPRQ